MPPAQKDDLEHPNTRLFFQNRECLSAFLKKRGRPILGEVCVVPLWWEEAYLLRYNRPIATRAEVWRAGEEALSRMSAESPEALSDLKLLLEAYKEKVHGGMSFRADWFTPSDQKFFLEWERHFEHLLSREGRLSPERAQWALIESLKEEAPPEAPGVWIGELERPFERALASVLNLTLLKSQAPIRPITFIECDHPKEARLQLFKTLLAQSNSSGRQGIFVLGPEARATLFALEGLLLEEETHQVAFESLDSLFELPIVREWVSLLECLYQSVPVSQYLSFARGARFFKKFRSRLRSHQSFLERNLERQDLLSYETLFHTSPEPLPSSMEDLSDWFALELEEGDLTDASRLHLEKLCDFLRRECWVFRPQDLARLRELLKESAAPSEFRREAPLWVFSSPEFLSEEFEALWVFDLEELGFEDRMNPYLPPNLQKDSGSTLLGRERKALLSRRLQALSRTTSLKILLSKANPESAWVKELLRGERKPLPESPPQSKASPFRPPLEPDLPALTSKDQKGGVYFLKSLSACLRQAQLKYQLSLKPPSLRETSKHDLQKHLGIALHNYFATQANAALEDIALHLQTHALQSLTRSHHAVPSLVEDMLKAQSEALAPKVFEFEHFLRVLGLEKASAEKEYDLRLSGLRLDLRLDQVLRLKDELVIVDFKLGEAGPFSRMDLPLSAPQGEVILNSRRPRNPQLWAYLLAEPHATGVLGAYFGGEKTAVEGRVSPGLHDEMNTLKEHQGFNLDLRGLVAFDSDLSAYRSFMTESLEARVRRFEAGEMTPDPLKGACQSCEFQRICEGATTPAPDDEDPQDTT